MWPFSQWNPILLLYTQECFSPGEWQDKLAVLWLFLKCISLRHCLPWFSYRNAFHTSCQNEHTPLDSKAFSPKVHLLFFFFLTPDVNWTQNIHHSVVNIIAFSFWVISGTGPAVPKVVCLPYINLELSSSFGGSYRRGGTDFQAYDLGLYEVMWQPVFIFSDLKKITQKVINEF